MLLRFVEARRFRLRRRLTRNQRLPDIRHVSTSTLHYLRHSLPPDQLQAAYVPVDSAQRFAPPPAKTLGPSRLTTGPHSMYRELFVVHMDNVRVYGEAGHVITRDGTLLADISFKTPAAFYQESSCADLYAQYESPMRLAGNTCILTTRSAGRNYYHFLFELLPRLEMIRRSGIDLCPVNQFIVNPLEFDVLWEALELCGVARKQLVVRAAMAAFELEHVIAPSTLRETGHMRRWVCEWLRHTFAPPSESARHPVRLYVGRDDAGYRKLENQAEILDRVLLPLGFESVRWTGQSIRSQAAVFANAEVVVGMNGAALANLVFCQPGTRVIVLHSPVYLSRCFYELCHTLDLDYYYLTGGTKEPLAREQRHHDYSVNASALAALLKLANVN